MIASMTAFASCCVDDTLGSLQWEIRCVNHRYLEVYFRLPELLRGYEAPLRELVSNTIRRGKVELFLKWQPAQSLQTILLNPSLLAHLQAAIKQLASSLPHSHLNLMDVLQWPGLVQAPEIDKERMQLSLAQSLTQAIERLQQARHQEGEGLVRFLQSRCEEILQAVRQVQQLLPKVKQKWRDKIVERFQECQLNLEQERLEQEMLWFMQKGDVAEELQRLEAHVEQVQSLLEQGGVQGRRLDFLMQELNREANTLSSKANDIQLTQAAVTIKVAIEQMREQVQNIE